MESWFGPEGRLRQCLSEFEFRPGQCQMAQAVAQGLAEGRWVIVEAGTGIGKTLAYLVPAAVGDHPLLVATGTIPLQEQLFHKDIPLLQRCGLKVEATVLKGRSHYLCLWKWRRILQAPPLALSEAGLLHRLQAWVRSTETGDRAECDALPEDHPLWSDLTADAQTCMGPRCAFFRDCYLYAARRKAERTQVVIINHHLLLADVHLRTQRDARLLPDIPHLVVDEAHMLEETAVSALTLTLSWSDFSRLLRELDTSLQACDALSDDALRPWPAFQGRVRTHALALFGARLGSERIPWTEVLGSHRSLVRHLEDLQATLQAMVPWIQGLPLPPEERDQFTLWASELAVLCGVFADDEEPADLVRYAEPSGPVPRDEPRWTLCAAPLQVGPRLAEALWPRFRSVVLTSATLRYRDRFDFLAERLGLPLRTREVDEPQQAEDPGAPLLLSIPSPFRWQHQTRLWIPTDMPEPRDPDFLPRLQARVEALIRLVGGSTLILCTSLQALQAIADYLEPRIPWRVYRQGSLPRRTLMERFRTDVQSVLVATASFWQGFDVPGEALRCVVIDKLPFDVPSDPVVRARIAAIRRSGQDPFWTYQLPRALTLLRQGLGRLIRSRTDVGIMALMDSRIWHRAYGRIILQELRPIPIVRAWEELERWWHDATARPPNQH